MMGGSRVSGFQYRRRGWSGLGLVAGLVLSIGLGGCGGGDGARPGGPKSEPPLYSPNGEPLNGGPLGQPSCADAMTRWLERTDTNHGGTVELPEFLADAQRQFAVMDLDKDGEITPAELTTYRAPYAQPSRERTEAARQAPDSDRQARRGRDGAPPRRNSGAGGGDGGASLAAEQPDPVMSADVSLRNRVSQTEFLVYARRQFEELDANHDGRLDKTEITRLCATSPR